MNETAILLYLFVLMSNQRKSERFTALQDEIFDASIKFTCSMIRSLVQHGPEENVIFSPVCIYATLALVFFGATEKSNTRREIAEILGLQPGIKSRGLLLVLNKLLLDIKVVPEKKDRFNRYIDIQNRIFVQKHTNLVSSYVSHIRSITGCEILNVDFENEPENVRNIINDCVSRNTNGSISRCLVDETVNRSTHMVFASCINLKLIWKNGFHDHSSTSSKFRTSRGDVDVSMMQYQTSEKLPYVDLPNLHIEVLELPFKEERESIYIILPKLDKSLDDVISSFGHSILRKIIDQVVPANVNLNLPSFNLTCTGNLYEALRNLGMNDAFTDQAQLDNMTTDHSLRVSKIIHAVDVEFGKEKLGTMTKIGRSFGSCSRVCKCRRDSPVSNPIRFDVNRPFLFFIFHRITKSILFLGVIRNPNVECD